MIQCNILRILIYNTLNYNGVHTLLFMHCCSLLSWSQHEYFNVSLSWIITVTPVMSIIVTYSHYRHEVKNTNATTRQFPIATPIIVSTIMISSDSVHIYGYSFIITVAVTSLPSHNLITITWGKLKYVRKSINIE